VLLLPPFPLAFIVTIPLRTEDRAALFKVKEELPEIESADMRNIVAPTPDIFIIYLSSLVVMKEWIYVDQSESNFGLKKMFIL